MSHDKSYSAPVGGTENPLAEIFEKLRAPFPASQVSWRIGARTADKRLGQALPYIDARDVQDRLDEVVGPQNWQVKFEQLPQGVLCRLSIRCGGEWISKEDVAQYDVPTGSRGTDLNQKRELAIKGAHSDAFKRSAVMWGIGRYLYRFNAPWVELTDDGRRFVNRPVLPAHMLPESERRSIRDEERRANSQSQRAPEQPQLTQQPVAAEASHQDATASQTRASVEEPAQPQATVSADQTSVSEAAQTAQAVLETEQTLALIGTDEQWNALSPKEQDTAAILIERIRKGAALHSVSDYLTTGGGKNLPEWLRKALAEQLANKQNAPQGPAAAA